MSVEVVLVAIGALVLAAPVLAVVAGGGRPGGGSVVRVGLIAMLPEEAGPALEAIRSLAGAGQVAALGQAGIRDLQGFTRRIEGRDCVVVYFAYDGGMPGYEAAAAFEEATGDIDWGQRVVAHPRAAGRGGVWMQMEWICFIAGREVDRPATRSVLLGTRVLPAMEMTYRTLHQTVWPGVAEQIARGNHRCLSIFLIELGEDLVEFLYMEYVGDDPQRDGEADRSDPVTRRWWKLTDACQQPFSDVEEGIWAPLEPVAAGPGGGG